MRVWFSGLVCASLGLAIACGDSGSGGGDGGTSGTGGGTGASGGTGSSGGTSGAGGGGGAGLASGGSSGDAGSDAPICPAAPVEHSFTALGPKENLLNPARGFHDFIDLGSTDDFLNVRKSGRTLAYAGVSLIDYVDAALPASFVAALSAGLDRVRAARIKVVLRFLYREEFTDPNDAKLSRILEHIQTLAPLIQKHADVIMVLEAGFIGPWGEWHSSTNGLDTNLGAKKSVLDALLAVVPQEMPVLVRRWSFKQEYAGGPATEAQAFGATAVARVGHHNDCFLSSADDVGTYPTGKMDAWKALIAEDTRFVPAGGETCADYPARTSCAVAVPEMAQLHWSFLNAVYHPGALARFKNEGCYDEIAARLGYRLVLEQATFPEQAQPGCGLSLSLKLRNDGFAPPYSAKELVFVLDGPTHFEATLPSEPRRWEPGAHSLDTSVSLPANLPAGSYQVALWLPDPSASLRTIPEYALQFANAAGWDAKTGLNVLGSLTVGP